MNLAALCIPLHEVQLTNIELLKPHPENYRYHPEDQVEEFIASIRQFGICKPIVTAIDYTILVGHGITQACQALDLAEVPVARRWDRPQHVVKDAWRKFDTPLKRKPGVDLTHATPDEYGMELKQFKPIRSTELQKLYDTFNKTHCYD